MFTPNRLCKITHCILKGQLEPLSETEYSAFGGASENAKIIRTTEWLAVIDAGDDGQISCFVFGTDWSGSLDLHTAEFTVHEANAPVTDDVN